MSNNQDLQKIRTEINEIDSQLVDLLVKRMALADQVAGVKGKNNIAVTDEKREEQVLERAVEQAGPGFKGETITFMRSLMAISKMRQRKVLFSQHEEELLPAPRKPLAGDLLIAFQGVPGAWGEQAARQYFQGAEYTAMDHFEDVFVAVKKKKASYGLVPIENSRTGAIGEVYDLLRKHGCYIVGQTWVKVRQCLLALPDAKLDDIREVFSHPEGFRQSDHFLHGRYWDLTACRNTAVAAEMVADKKEKRYAAIGSRRAAELYGLQILVPDIMDDDSNQTRFIVIADTPEYDGNSDTVSLIFRTAHRSGALCDVLFAFLQENINLSRLESRPMTGGKYGFFADLSGNIETPSVIAGIRQAAASCGHLEVLGCYQEEKRGE